MTGIILSVLALIWVFIIFPFVIGPIVGDVFNEVNSALTAL
jgi:hypothetical protein